MSIILKVEETKDIPHSHAFYQLHNRLLSIIFPKENLAKKYFATVLLGYLNIDLSFKGEPLYIEINLPKKEWKIKDNLQIPYNFKCCKIFLNPDQNQEFKAEYFTNKKFSILYVRFSQNQGNIFKVSDTVFVDLDFNNNLNGVYFNNICNDFLYIKESFVKRTL